MSRSKWKIPFFEKQTFQNLNNKKSNSVMVLVSREIAILPSWVSKTVFIYNGKFFFKLRISQRMVGFKFGEFSSTTVSAKYMEKKEKRKHLNSNYSY